MNNTITATYRVVSTTETGFVDPKVDTTIVWEGADTDELSVAYPPSDILFADPFDQKEIEGGFIITRFTFEKQLADGSWEKIDDPRRRLTPITAYEKAIDEENRRLYPGDYMSDCDDCGYDPCRCDPYEDQYRVGCKSCNDYGCAKCDPNWCKNCDNNGCATCDPDGVCNDCKKYAGDGDQLDENRRCTVCAHYARLCKQCEYDKFDAEDGLCTGCRSSNEWEAAPRCSECGDAIVANEGDNCEPCQSRLDALCDGCQYNAADGDDKLCCNCREYDAECERYYVWWRRALRACMFWR